MRFLLQVFAVLCLLFSICVGLTLVQIEPEDRGLDDLLVAGATFAALFLSGWLLLRIALALKTLG